MSKVSYIHGVPQDEWAQRGEQVSANAFINPMVLSDGQLGAMLLHRQLNILSSFYEENQDFKVAKQEVAAAMRRGVHKADLKTGGNDFIRKVNKRLNNLKIKRRASINGPKQESLSNAIIEHYLGGSNTAPAINLDMCAEAYREVIGVQSGGWDGLGLRDKIEAGKYCEQQIELITSLNENIDPSSHHLLAEWAPFNAPSAVTTKRILHSNAISSLANITTVSRSNMKAWVRTGIMATNVAGGTEPHQPERSYQFVADYWSSGGEVKVGEPVTASIIIGAIISAITATARLIESLGQQKATALRNAAQGIGNREFGLNEDDFPYSPPGQGTGVEGGDIQQYLPYILGGAGLLLLTQNK